MWFMALLLAVFVVGCGSGSSGTAPEPAAIGGGSGDAPEPITEQAATTTTSPDYGVWNDNSGCLTSSDPTYNNKLGQLAKDIFHLPTAPLVGTGCITEPYLASGYTQYLPDGGLENHAGIDFRAAPGTSAYALYNGTVVREILTPEANPPGSTLVIESQVGLQTLRVFYLHCQSHNNEAGSQLVTGTLVSAGDRVCQTGSVGAAAAHLHLEVKLIGMDGNDLRALFGSHCNPPSSFTAFDNSIKTGCNLGDIRARTVDPIILIVE